jgi:adenylate kinase family enzyme
MKTENKLLTQWVLVIGQSGSGKEEAITILQEFYKKAGICFILMSTSGLMNERGKKDTYVARRLKEISNAGERQPAISSGSAWFAHIHDNLKGEDHNILQEGSPRGKSEAKMVLSLLKKGIIKSLTILELKVPDHICRCRIKTRTIATKREDTSVDGQPGVPDLCKINTKLFFWTEAKKKIRKLAKKAGVYRKIKNTGTLEELKENLAVTFGFV